MLSPSLDIDALALAYRSHRFAVAADALDEQFTERVRQRLESWQEWGLATRIGDQHRLFDSQAMAAMPADKLREFDALVAAQANRGFQYLYDRYPVFERGQASALDDATMQEVYGLLCSEAFLDLGRRITGEPAIAFAHGQVTRYRQGHFLTLHNDIAEGQDRVAAFVLNLTPGWRPEFGGQLQLLDEQDNVLASIPPRMNLLSVFAVPTPHLVSIVAPFADRPRLAMTGWFRRA